MLIVYPQSLTIADILGQGNLNLVREKSGKNQGILLSIVCGNPAKMPPTSTVSSLLNQTPPISELSKNKLPKKPTRSEPLCVFATLELTAKQLGCNSTEEINALGKQIVENSKKFLGTHKATTNTTFYYIWLCLRDTITEPYVIIALLMALYVLLFYLFSNITQISLFELVKSLIKERYSERQSHSSFVQNVLFKKCSR